MFVLKTQVFSGTPSAFYRTRIYEQGFFVGIDELPAKMSLSAFIGITGRAKQPITRQKHKSHLPERPRDPIFVFVMG